MKTKILPLLIVLFLFSVKEVRAGDLVLVAGPGNGGVARLGAALASILTDGSVHVKAAESAGDAESIEDVLSGSADLAVVDSLSAYEAALGIGRFSPAKKKGLLAAAVVGLSVEHFLLVGPTQDNDDIGALSGKMLYLGPDGDPETYAARTVLTASGIESFFEVGMGWNYETAAELMVDGTFDGAVFSGVAPLDPVSHLTSVMGNNVVLLGVSDEELVAIRSQWPIWFPYVVPGKTYPAVDKPYQTIARPILLVTSRRLDAATVQYLLSRLFEKAGTLPASGFPYPLTESMTPTYCPVTLHPGAAEYFKEHTP